MWMHTWGSPHNSNPKWPFAVGRHKGVRIAGKLSQRLCPPPGTIKEITNDQRRICVGRPQQFQTGGTQHGAMRLPGSRFLADLENLKSMPKGPLWFCCHCQPTYNCVDNAQGACHIGRPAIPLPLLVNLEYQINWPFSIKRRMEE